MKKSTVAGLTVASLAGVAGLANAISLGPDDLPQSRGATISLGVQGGGAREATTVSNLGLATTFRPTIVSKVNPNVTPLTAVPEGSSSLLLLGMGMLALAVWRRRLGHRFVH